MHLIEISVATYFKVNTRYDRRKKPRLSEAYLVVKTRNTDYLFITYIVTSKPKRISVAAGVVHIIFLLLVWCTRWCVRVYILRFYKHIAMRKIMIHLYLKLQPT